MMLEEIFDKSLETWGLDAQLNMLAEELAELMTATFHLLRSRAGALAEFVEEIADVELMIDEMKHYFTITNQEIAMYKELKIALLEVKLSHSLSHKNGDEEP